MLVNNSDSSPEQDGHCFCPQGSARKTQITWQAFEEGCDKVSSRKSEVTYYSAD